MRKQYICRLVTIAPSGAYYPIGDEFVLGDFHPIIRTPRPITVTFTPPDDGAVPEPLQTDEWEFFCKDDFGRLLYKKKELE